MSFYEGRRSFLFGSAFSSGFYNLATEGFDRRTVLQRVYAIGSSRFSAFCIDYKYFLALDNHFRTISQRCFLRFHGNGFSGDRGGIFSLGLERNISRSSGNYESGSSNHHVLLHFLSSQI